MNEDKAKAAGYLGHVCAICKNPIILASDSVGGGWQHTYPAHAWTGSIHEAIPDTGLTMSDISSPENRSRLDLRTMLLGDVNRLRYVTRYSTSLVMHRETVAEHSHYVSLYAMFLCRWVKRNTKLNVDELRVLQRCIIHDVDECRSGDFQRPFKYKSPELRSMLEAAAEDEVHIALTTLFPDDRIYVEQLVSAWSNSKDLTTEGRIVAFADYLSVISHLYAEVACANLSVMQHYTSLCEYMHRFDDKSFDFLRPLINQTREIFAEMMHSAGYDRILQDDLEKHSGGFHGNQTDQG